MMRQVCEVASGGEQRAAVGDPTPTPRAGNERSAPPKEEEVQASGSSTTSVLFAAQLPTKRRSAARGSLLSALLCGSGSRQVPSHSTSATRPEKRRQRPAAVGSTYSNALPTAPPPQASLTQRHDRPNARVPRACGPSHATVPTPLLVHPLRVAPQPDLLFFFCRARHSATYFCTLRKVWRSSVSMSISTSDAFVWSSAFLHDSCRRHTNHSPQCERKFLSCKSPAAGASSAASHIQQRASQYPT